MPRASWGVDASDVDDFDRESQYKPYAGPIPPNTVYLWRIKVLKHAAGTKDKNPQLRVGLELVPREEREGEEDYEGYFRMCFLPITGKTQFRYVPFLDAIGVTGREFAKGTMTDEEGNIRKIGNWKNSGEELILAELKDGQNEKGESVKEIGTFLPAEEYGDDEEDDEYYDGDDE